ncbi:iron-containing alcohol dehydrogenase [Priestia abyssalis]|uniref:iron-containing alcohol dehydrogenase n=1 Tax=Priestia abyssalis TaxID=1221450 RepID=UPI000994A30D|nr:iron-containing alcohol dehydrogenase [Priestia abyssalis]
MSFHQLLMPNNILYGKDSFAEIGKLAKELGQKVLIISDPIMDKIGNVELCEKYLQEKGVPYAKYLGVDSEPTDVHVDEALAICREEACDVVAAVGGGSCIDTAKAVAVLVTNGGHIRDYYGGKKAFDKKLLPLIAVPTTAGTGSEVTAVTVITDTKHDIKMMLKQPGLMPAAAIVDPMLTLSCPSAVTAATGVDALCHAIEAFISKRSQPVTDTLALKAIELITENIRKAYEDGKDIEARDNMALGSMLAGMAFSNASVTLVHGMSRPIGAMFHVPHGVSNAMLLPAVLEFTKGEAQGRLAVIGRLVKPETRDLSDREVVAETVKEIKKLCLDLNIPNLKTWGVDRAPFEKVLSKMATDAIASGSPGNNPRVPTHEEIVQLYQVCYEYDFSEKTETSFTS